MAAKVIGRLTDFFFVAHRYRWRAYIWSFALGTLYGWTRISIFHQAEKTAIVGAAAVLIASMAVWVVWFVAKVAPQETDSYAPYFNIRIPPSTGAFFANASGYALVLVLLLAALGFLYFPTPKVQAAVLDMQLNSVIKFLRSPAAATAPDKEVERRIDRIDSIVKTSAKKNLPLNQNSLKDASANLSSYLQQRDLPEQTKQLGLAAAVDLNSLAYRRELETGAIKPLMEDRPSYVFNSVLPFPSDATIVGNNTLFSVNESFVIKDHVVTFDGIDFVGTFEPIIVQGTGSVTIRNSSFQAGEQSLDNINWINVRFHKTRVTYRGGPVTLRNVTFAEDCDFGPIPWGFDQGPGATLWNLIHDAHGTPVTFVYLSPKK